MEIKEAPLAGVLTILPRVFPDNRGYFFESFQNERYREAGIASPFVQDNTSRSSYGTLRGLHYQLKQPQGKLVSVMRGEVFDVAIDIRKGSPTFGKWFGAVLSDENHLQLYVPPGYAHGFCVLSEIADFCYKCTDYYVPDDEYGIVWNDPAIAIEWSLHVDPIMSEKDLQLPTLTDINPKLLPDYEDFINRK